MKVKIELELPDEYADWDHSELWSELHYKVLMQAHRSHFESMLDIDDPYVAHHRKWFDILTNNFNWKLIV